MNFYKTENGYVATIGKLDAEQISKEEFENVMSDAISRQMDAQQEPTPEERLAELEAQNQMLTQCLMEMSKIVYA